MKTLFIPLFKKEEFNSKNLNLNKLPDTIYITYTIQYRKIAEKAREALQEKGKKSLGFQQVLGCTALKINSPILLISDGSFHAANLLSQDNEVYLFDNYSLTRLSQQKTISRLNKLYSSDKIGVIISQKPGQYNAKEAGRIKSKLLNQGKQAYFFLADNINTTDLENFDIDFWLNTACPGLMSDRKKIINSAEI